MSRSLYRNRNGVIFGVCSGIADRFDLSVMWLRVLVVATTFLTGIAPGVIIYVIAALVLKPEPDRAYLGRDYEREMGASFSGSKSEALNRLKGKLERLERRTRDMENVVTDREFDWERRLRTGQ